jgi:hypothetical protein
MTEIGILSPASYHLLTQWHDHSVDINPCKMEIGAMHMGGRLGVHRKNPQAPYILVELPDRPTHYLMVYSDSRQVVLHEAHIGTWLHDGLKIVETGQALF